MRFDAKPNGSTVPVKVAATDGNRLVMDAEGVTIAPVGARGGYVIVSSQGDSAYAVYALKDDRYIGRFRIAPGAVGSTEETDGITLVVGDSARPIPAGCSWRRMARMRRMRRTSSLWRGRIFWRRSDAEER